MTTHQSIKLTMNKQQEDRVEFLSQKEFRRSKSDAKILSESRPSSKSNYKVEIERVECECCGIGEECTPMYIKQIRLRFCGRWVCGLCSEAVKEERLNQRASRAQEMEMEMEMEAALQSHMAVCRSFKSSTLINPQLSLASAMRDIAKKSLQQRLTHTAGDFLAASVAASRRPPPANGKYRRSSFH